jgi:lipopolysaccharide transport system ATP-binding protein
MNNVNAIEILNLSKKYQLGVIGTGMLSHDLNQWWSRFKSSKKDVTLHREENNSKDSAKYEEIWALKDINLDIKNGEVLGVIGKNGAGKSTLLKILSQITTPTSGSAILRGRVGSLLEVGTGFHPELTGRENIYLNGAILGMKRKEIDKHLDEIIDFSGVIKYIDTPIKRYSSGMNVRLAFSVAAHLDTEILIVDEVLAVGDYEFQKKCIKKIGNVSTRGKTVLLVSHNMSSISNICDRVVLLEMGKIIEDGRPENVIESYLTGGGEINPHKIFNQNQKTLYKKEKINLLEVKVLNKNGNIKKQFDVTEDIIIECIFKILDDSVPYIPSMFLKNEKGIVVFHAVDTSSFWDRKREIGQYSSKIIIPKNILTPGVFFYTQLISTINHASSEKYIRDEDVISFNVHDSWTGSSAVGNLKITLPGGIIRPKLKWYQKQLDK